MKVNLFNKTISKRFLSFITFEGTILGIISILFNDFLINNKKIVLLLFIIISVLYYILEFLYANFLTNITLNIQSSTFKIKKGNIFNEKGLKVINFNEYFDTKVDNKVIANNSLNGIFINKFIDDVKELDKIIDVQLENAPGEENKTRKDGKKIKYELGTIVEYNDDYLLTALTKFDENNMANTNLKDYLSFLMNFWNNLNIVFANRSVSITLFGSSSLSRFTDAYDISEQQLIEIILWTFKISKIKFKYPTTISLILSNDLINKINLYEIKEMYKNGI